MSLELNGLQFLKEVFPLLPEDEIRQVQMLVEQESPDDSPEEKLENMFNMLANNAMQNQENQQEGAVGYACDSSLNQLQQLFPDACENYLRKFCEKNYYNFNLDAAVDTLVEDGYDRKVMDKDAIWNNLKEALPSADPSYLKEQVDKLANGNQYQLQDFVIAALESNNYPTMEQYLRRTQAERNLKFYKEDFSVEKFLEVISDPETYFKDPNRKNPLQDPAVSQADTQYALTILYNQYPDIRKRHVDLAFRTSKNSLLASCSLLDKVSKGLRNKRAVVPLPSDCQNLALLQEIAYINHRTLIRRILKYKNQVYQQFTAECSKLGMLETCRICDEELIPDECFYCNKHCMFCKDCVRKYVEVRMGDGHTTFPCCNNCDSQFGIHILQLVLPQPMFARLLLKIQSAEIKQANVDGLEACPFCEFVMIPSGATNVFKCENPECSKESCRLCRHESHVPKRCNEIEYDEDVRMRTYVEDKMTEALTRTCYNCQKKFIKSSGCNKMTCSCGSMMCYLCLEPVKGYGHFGDEKPCKLYTNDTEINLNRVRKNAERAKKDLGQAHIKFDPTIGIEDFFQA